MPAMLDLDNTFGALLIGVVVSAMLFGVTCIQTFYYFQNYSSDKLLVKLFVIILLVLEALHLVLNTYSIYHYTIISYNDPPALLNAIWSVSAELAQSSVVIFTVHMFYARRVYYVSQKNVYLVTLIFALALAQFGTHILVTVKAFQLHYFIFSPQITPYLTAPISLAVATDITIAASLSFYLHKNRSGISSTDTMINRLIVHAINNGILTSVSDILVLTFATAYPRNMIYIAIYQVISNLYANSVLATLNSRRSMMRAGEITRISFGSACVMSTVGEPGRTKFGIPQVDPDPIQVQRDSIADGVMVRHYAIGDPPAQQKWHTRVTDDGPDR